MIELFIYHVSSGKYSNKLQGTTETTVASIPEGFDFTLTPPPDYKHVWMWVENKWVELLPVNNPDIKPSDTSKWDKDINEWVECAELAIIKKENDQCLIWDQIKEKRLSVVSSGVLVPSTGKVFHTDNLSAIQYSTVAGMIALGNYQPIPWKVMDNTWLMLSEEVFKDLQTAMSAHTNNAYAVAEQHKEAMMQTEDPLSYDFSSGW